MNDIIPSVRLKVVTVHKIQAMSCWRSYFWHWIMNLEPRKMNLNFWYGACFHAGFETLLMKGGLSAALVEMLRESRKRQARYIITGEDAEEIAVQTQIIMAFIKTAARQPWVKRLHLLWREKQFRCLIEDTGITFCSTIDGGGSCGKDDALFEFKTASRVSNEYFETLGFDYQINGYAYQMKVSNKRFPTKCAYCVFRKPSKYIKKNQTADGFVQEIKEDLAKRPDWYFVVDPHNHVFPYLFTLGKSTVEQTGKSIIAATKILQQRYEQPEKELLNPLNWPCNDRQCLNYGACQYLMMCRNMSRWQLYLRLYQQREMMYEEEKKELKL